MSNLKTGEISWLVAAVSRKLDGPGLDPCYVGGAKRLSMLGGRSRSAPLSSLVGIGESDDMRPVNHPDWLAGRISSVRSISNGRRDDTLQRAARLVIESLLARAPKAREDFWCIHVPGGDGVEDVCTSLCSSFEEELPL